MSERVAGRKRNQRQGGGHGLVELARVPQCANQPVVRFSVCRISRDCRAKCPSRRSSRSGSKQVETLQVVRFGSRGFGCGHGYL